MVAADHHAHAVRGEGIDVVERQRRDHHLLRLLHQRQAILAELGKLGVDLQHVRHQVAVGEHRPLRDPGGAAGVLQHGDILQADPDRLQGMALALLQGLPERQRLGQAIIGDHLLHRLHHAVHQPTLQRRQQVAHARLDQVLDPRIREHFLDQLAEHVQVDQRTHAGVLELVAHFAGGVQRIGVDHHQPRAQGAEHRDGILQDIGHLHRDAVAGLEIGLFLQVGGEGGGQTIEFGVAERHAEIAEGRAVGEFLAGALEDLDHGTVGGEVETVGYAGRAFVVPEFRLHLFLSSYLSGSGPRVRGIGQLSSCIGQRKYSSCPY